MVSFIRYEKASKHRPDPTIGAFLPSRVFGSISENMGEIINSYWKRKEEEGGNPYLEKTEYLNMMYLECMKGMAVPGDPVGVLAAQVISFLNKTCCCIMRSFSLQLMINWYVFGACSQLESQAHR